MTVRFVMTVQVSLIRFPAHPGISGGTDVCSLEPGHINGFSSSWPRHAEFSSVSMTSAEDARFSTLRFHPASEWVNSATFRGM